MSLVLPQKGHRKPSVPSATLHPSACLLYQPDAAAQPDQDQRSYTTRWETPLRHVRLTLEGERHLVAMRDICRYYRNALEGSSTKECLALLRLLDRLRDSLGRIAGAEQE